MRITVDLLQSLDACSPGIEAFKLFLNGRKYVLPTQQNLQLAADAGLDVLWLVVQAELTVDGLTTRYGSTYWYKDGRLHRVDGPAVISGEGTREWWRGGLPHRVGGPAFEYADGTRRWYENGMLIHTERT